MIRLALRQFRATALLALAALAVVAVSSAITASRYETAVAGCKAKADCTSLTAQFLGNDSLVQLIGIALILVPGIIGIFWGAPLLARELETGTYRLALTQSVTRTRWIAVKLGLFGLASIVVAALFSLMANWWLSPIDRVNMSPFSVFDQRDIVPVGYAGFAYALGATAGVLIRRTVPAMAATLVGFVAVRLAIEYAARPNFAAQLTLSQTYSLLDDPITSHNPQSILSVVLTPLSLSFKAGDWVISNNTVNAAGQVVNNVSCNAPGASTQAAAQAAQAALQACLAQYRQVAMYQPASRYWAFQWDETAIFACLAIILLGFCFWWASRRLT